MDKPPGMNEWYWIAVAFAVIVGCAFLGAGTNSSGDESNNGVFITIGVVLMVIAALGMVWLLRTTDLSAPGAKIGTAAFVLICIGAVLITISDGGLSTVGYAVGAVGVAGWLFAMFEGRKTKQFEA